MVCNCSLMFYVNEDSSFFNNGVLQLFLTDIYGHLQQGYKSYLLCKIYSPDPGGSSLVSDDDHYWSTRVHGQIYDTRDLDTLLFRHPHSLSDQTHLFKTLPIYTKCRRDNGLFQDFFPYLILKMTKNHVISVLDLETLQISTRHVMSMRYYCLDLLL